MRIVKSYKEKGGKLVEIYLTIDRDCIIREFQITGDFFAYPPEKVDYLKNLLIDQYIRDVLFMTKLEELISNITWVGVSASTLLKIISEILREGASSCVKK
jgi:hypothetical protein